MIGLTGMTSLLAYATTRYKGTLEPASLRERFWDLFEWIGAFGCFLAANLLFGLLIIIIVRSITQHFMGVYELEDPLLAVFSAAQAFVFQLWWKRK
jgi:hypothetical protein